jgi:hypothetical protein
MLARTGIASLKPATSQASLDRCRVGVGAKMFGVADEQPELDERMPISVDLD